MLVADGCNTRLSFSQLKWQLRVAATFALRREEWSRSSLISKIIQQKGIRLEDSLEFGRSGHACSGEDGLAADRVPGSFFSVKLPTEGGTLLWHDFACK